MIRKTIIILCIFVALLSNSLADEYSEAFRETWERWYTEPVYVEDPVLESELILFAEKELEILFPSLTEQQLNEFECWLPIQVFYEDVREVWDVDMDAREVWYVDMVYCGIESVSITLVIARDDEGMMQLLWNTPWEMDKIIAMMDTCITKEEALAVASVHLDERIKEFKEDYQAEGEMMGSNECFLIDSSAFTYDYEFSCEYNQGQEPPTWSIYFETSDQVAGGKLFYRLKMNARTGTVITESALEILP